MDPSTHSQTRGGSSKGLAIARRIVQAAAFVLFPGLFISTFSAIGDIVTALISGSFSPAALAMQLILALSMVGVTAIFGRFFCGFLCSFGAMGDLLHFIAKKLHIPQLEISEPVDRGLKWVKTGLLVLTVLVVWILGAFNGATDSPWTVFGFYATWEVWKWPSAANWLTLGGVLLLGIIAGSLFIERFYCRYLCPLGAIFALVSRHRLFRIDKPTQGCGRCRACTKRCPMGIPLYGMDEVDSGECIDCFACKTVCPRDNVSMRPVPAVAAVIAVAALMGLFYFANTAGTAIASNAAAQSAASSSSSSSDTSGGSSSSSTTAPSTSTSTGLKDGTYTGSGTGYRGTTSVTVTVSGGQITDITIDSFADDSQYFNRAQSTIISEMLSAQSVDVDTVSGATFSSNGIKEAVANALGVSFTNPNSTMQSSHDGGPGGH